MSTILKNNFISGAEKKKIYLNMHKEIPKFFVKIFNER